MNDLNFFRTTNERNFFICLLNFRSHFTRVNNCTTMNSYAKYRLATQRVLNFDYDVCCFKSLYEFNHIKSLSFFILYIYIYIHTKTHRF